MKKFLTGLVLVAGIASADLIEPGLNILPLLTTDSVIHGGETLFTKTNSFNNVSGLSGICILGIGVDSCGTCSTKYEIGIYEGSSDGDWDLVTSCWTDNACADQDTTAEIPFLPAAFWRLWLYDANSNNDSLRVRSPIYLYVVRN